MKRSSGFTLVEIILTLAILTLVVVISVPTFSHIMDDAEDDTAEISVSNMAKSAQSAEAAGLARDLERGYSLEYLSKKGYLDLGDASPNGKVARYGSDYYVFSEGLSGENMLEGTSLSITSNGQSYSPNLTMVGPSSVSTYKIERLDTYKGKKNVFKVTNPPAYVNFNPKELYTEGYKAGETYTISLSAMYEGKGNGANPKAYAGSNIDSYRPLEGKFTDTEFNRLYRSFTPTSDTTGRIHLDFRGYDVVYIAADIKVEKGDKVTPYTPAVKDLERIDYAYQYRGENLIDAEDVGKSYAAKSREYISTVDLEPIFQKYGLDQTYSVSMELKSTDTSTADGIRVYMQNGSGTKHGLVNQSVQVTEEWQRYTFDNLTPFKAATYDKESKSTLSFYGTYGTGNFPMVRNIKVELGPKSTPFKESK